MTRLSGPLPSAPIAPRDTIDSQQAARRRL